MTNQAEPMKTQPCADAATTEIVIPMVLLRAAAELLDMTDQVSDACAYKLRSVAERLGNAARKLGRRS
jgi:hypothetical protein